MDSDSQTLVIRSHLEWLRADRKKLEESLNVVAVSDDAEEAVRLENIHAEIGAIDEMISRYQHILQLKMLDTVE